jgi:hypothetical protein
MTENDPFLMIGLHKLAEERGDGFAPELLMMLLERGRRDLAALQSSEPLAGADDMMHLSSETFSGRETALMNDNVIAFPAPKPKIIRR